MYRVIHFEISADVPERAIAFYQKIFGWKFTKWAGPKDYWAVTTGESDTLGINGGLFIRGGPVNYVNTVQVPDVDEIVRQVEAAGGQVAVPKTAIPGLGYLAYCKDSEGNVFGVMHDDPSAK